MAIVPTNLKKNVLSKAVQSPNALVVSETLKLICALIDRYRVLVGEMANENEQYTKLLSKAFVRRLPDLQVLFRLQSRLIRLPRMKIQKASTSMTGLVCKVLDAYVSFLPDTLSARQIRSIKLLPENATAFCPLTFVLQVQLLQTLERILALHEVRRNSDCG